jgi:hypothetical protein
MAYYSSDDIFELPWDGYTLNIVNAGFENTAPILHNEDASFNADGITWSNANINSLGQIRVNELMRTSPYTAIGGMPTRTRNILFSIPVKVNGVVTYRIVAYYRTAANNTNNWTLRVIMVNNNDTTVIGTASIQTGFAGLVGVLPIRQTISGEEVLGYIIYYYKDGENGKTNYPNISGSIVTIRMDKVREYLEANEPNYEIMEVDLWEESYGEPSTEGGYTGGTFDDSSDTISIPTAPTMGVTSAGFINVYSPTQGELVQFGSELFPDLSFTPVSQGGTPASVTDALVAMAQVLVDFGNQIPALIDMYINANLIQYVIDCHILPVAPATLGTSPLKVGFKTFSQTPAKVTSDYVDFDCGSLNVGEYYANFIDYAPYTTAKLYLPFVGFMDIAPEYWQSGTLSVTYRFNVIDGSFVAYVKSTSSKSKLSDTVIAQFGGNACVHIPITGLNYASMVSGIVSAVSPLLPSSKSGAGTADTLVNSANTIASAKPTMQQSNGYNATTSFLTVRVPYLLIERSVSNFSRNFPEENGIPSNITMSFAGLTGFTKATMLHLDGIAGATDDDLNEIAQLLSEGVIL